LVISVLGNFNRGKTHIIFKLCGVKDVPAGFNISTEGFSIKYPADPKDGLTFLDVAGNDIALNYGKLDNEEGSSNEIKSRMSIDRIHTDNFYHEFVINNSDVFICVVNKLTFGEQKLINKLKLSIGRKEDRKELLIFHNLYDYTNIEEVKKYIEETLLVSFPFEKKGRAAYIREKGDQNNDSVNIYYYLEDDEKDKPEVTHHILAKDDTEAGKFYNNSTYDFVWSKIKGTGKRKQFDPVDCIRKQLIANSKIIFEDEKAIEDVVLENNLLKFKTNTGNVKLQSLIVDSLGYNSRVVEKYAIYKNEKELKIVLEEPNVDINTIKIKISPVLPLGIMYEIMGEKKKFEIKEGYKELFNTTSNMDRFHFEVMISTEEAIFIQGKPVISDYNDGVIIITYALGSGEY
jgi:hypothetical protein